jgi:hypothetical protein
MSQLKTMQDENLPIWLPRLAVHGGPRFLQIANVLLQCLFIVRSRAKVNRLEESYVSRAA